MIKLLIKDIVKSHAQREDPDRWDLKGIYEYTKSLFNVDEGFKKELEKIVKDYDTDKKLRKKNLLKKVVSTAISAYKDKEKKVGEKALRRVEKIVMLKTIDHLWIEHIDNMQFLREGVGLRGYGQRDPLIEYKREGFEMYQDLLSNIRLQVIESLFKATIQVKSTSKKPEDGGVEAEEAERVEEKSYKLSGPSDNQSSLLKNASVNRGEGGGQAPIREKKVGRNEPCPCGSGKKYKKCCGKK